jgi:hypothetical protein
MYSTFVTDSDEGWFVYTCTGCGSEIRFGPYNVVKGTEQFQQAQLQAQAEFHAEHWSSDLKCLKCQARRRGRQSRTQ